MSVLPPVGRGSQGVEELADLRRAPDRDEEGNQGEGGERRGKDHQPERVPAHRAAPRTRRRSGNASEPATRPRAASPQLRFPAVATLRPSGGRRYPRDASAPSTKER